MPETLRALSRTTVPLHGQNIVGIAALRALFTASVGPEPRVAAGVPAAPMPALPPLGTLVDDSATARHGLGMGTGKGGVGTTTIAAAIATDLAARGFPVHLTTTDPAAHVAATLAITVPGLTVRRIDPAVETQAYRHRALENAAPTLDAQGLAFLEEDLHSPCTEEVAVFHAFARLVSEAQRVIVVMDTAPTGHTLLLRDATGRIIAS